MKKLNICILLLGMQGCSLSNAPNIQDLKQQVSNLETINKLKSQIADLQKQKSTSSLPVSTSTPIPVTTPVPTPVPTSVPTPVPTPVPTLIPIPSGYPIPTGINKCRVSFGKIISSSNNVTFSDWQSPIQFEVGSSVTQYINLFYSSSYPKLGIGIPSLNPGTYLGSRDQILADKNSVSVLVFYWSNDLVEWSYTDPIGNSEVKIEGNQNGYIWGYFKGTVGKSITSNTVISGKLSCIP